jgi:hypothetical protein
MTRQTNGGSRDVPKVELVGEIGVMREGERPENRPVPPGIPCEEVRLPDLDIREVAPDGPDSSEES